VNILHGLSDVVLQAGQLLGYIITFAVVFGETGTLLGSILPGDTFLFSLGLAASQGLLNIWILLAVTLVAAVTGDSAGYWFGKKLGQRLYSRPDGRWLKQAHIRQARDAYLKNGGSALVVARFTPIIRSLAPIVAGAAEMPYRQFISFNILGGVLWVLSMTLLGFFLGSTIPNIDRYVLPIVGVILVVSVGIGYREFRKSTKVVRPE
jgi:membrane-associated protein